MAIALVQQANNSSGATSSLAITIAAPAAGSSLYLFAGENSFDVTGVSGGGVTWVKAKDPWSFYSCDIWYGENSSGSGTTITVTLGGSTRCAAVVAEFSGIKTSSSFESGASGTGASGTSTSASPGAIDPTASPCLYLAMAATTNSTFTGTVGGGFTKFTDPTPAGGALSVQAAYLIDNSGHASATPTFGILASAAWDSAGAAFLGTVGGGSTKRDAMGTSGFFGV